ncbi:hypothetical protein [Sphingomonas sp.]|uniref:hypothetical protein n=1 Tax=Sphingomonas sp. TaxID=28214 RepID=UPI001E054914|nr:hypothetical protein [Sphingomonas sp.]MBX9796909.1 hypothetical protein [Sphingomonas sp.]
MDRPPPRRTPIAGGFLIALSSLAGAFAGGLNGQPSAGLLLGVAGGVALAVAIWLRDRR